MSESRESSGNSFEPARTPEDEQSGEAEEQTAADAAAPSAFRRVSSVGETQASLPPVDEEESPEASSSDDEEDCRAEREADGGEETENEPLSETLGEDRPRRPETSLPFLLVITVNFLLLLLLGYLGFSMLNSRLDRMARELELLRVRVERLETGPEAFAPRSPREVAPSENPMPAPTPVPAPRTPARRPSR